MERIITRIDQLIEQGTSVLATKQRGDWGNFVDFGKMKGFRAAALSFIERVYGKNHSHYTEFNTAVDREHPSDAEAGISIL